MNDCSSHPQDRRASCIHADEAADKAATRAVKALMAEFGVDTENPESKKKFVEGLWFGQRLKEIADKSVMGGVAAIVVLAISALALGIKMKITGE